MSKPNSSPLEIIAAGERLVYSGDYQDAVFSKTLRPLFIPSSWSGQDRIKTHQDPYNDYILNSYNYRSPEFSEGTEILAAGCSQTFGIGVPENGTWPHFLSKLTGMSYANLSAPGASIEWIVTSILRYIKTFGAPKYIVCYFPDLIRGEIAVDGVTTKAEETNDNDFLQQAYDGSKRDWEKSTRVLTHLSLDSTNPENPSPKLIKKPYEIEHTTTKIEAVRKSIVAIRTLEAYCSAANINLLWSSWSEQLVDLALDLPERQAFDCYFDPISQREWKSQLHELVPTEEDPEGIADYKLVHNPDVMDQYGCSDDLEGVGKCVCFTTCHFDMIPEFPESFHLATDRLDPIKGKAQAHLGVHRHAHIAEDFYSNLIRLNWKKED